MQGSSLSSIYIILMSIAFTRYFGNYDVSNKVQLIIGALWIGIATIAKLSKSTIIKKNSDVMWFSKMFIMPEIILHIYSIFLIAIGVVDTKFLTTNATTYIPILAALFAVEMFKEKALRYSVISIVISWLVSAVSIIFAKGFQVIRYAFIQTFIDHKAVINGITRNYFELHDLVLALGYLICFYFFTNQKITRKNVVGTIIVIAILSLGLKRITLLGVFAAYGFYHFLKNKPSLVRYRFGIATGYVILALSYLFVFMLANGGEFLSKIESMGINTMGRSTIFLLAMNMAEFSPGFLGIGRNVLNDYFFREIAPRYRVAAVHSDILKIYIENGFIMFGVWLLLYNIVLPKKIKKRFGEPVTFFYLVINIYRFCMYFTDNTENYFICTMLSIILPMIFALKFKKQQAVEG